MPEGQHAYCRSHGALYTMAALVLDMPGRDYTINVDSDDN